jgi:hypothetical protein
MYRITQVAALALLLPASVAWSAVPGLDAAFQPNRAPVHQATPEVPEPAPAPASAPPEQPARKMTFEVGFRGRMLSVPNTVMDIWYFNEKEPGWALPGEARPRIRGYSGGIEFVVKGDTANGLFYFEYVKSTMDEGYWDDIESPDDHLDGEYFRPSDNLGLAVLGANYAYEAHIVKSASTRGKFAWSLVVGGGLGVSYRTGFVEQWVADGDCEDDQTSFVDPAYKVYQQGDPSCGPANFPPRVLPMVDVTAGMRFTFGDRLVLRVEGGLHTLVFYGASAGLMF